MDFEQATKSLKRVGVSRASEDALAASYAALVTTTHGGKPEIYYDHLKKFRDPRKELASLIGDRARAWDVLMGLGEGTEECGE